MTGQPSRSEIGSSRRQQRAATVSMTCSGHACNYISLRGGLVGASLDASVLRQQPFGSGSQLPAHDGSGALHQTHVCLRLRSHPAKREIREAIQLVSALPVDGAVRPLSSTRFRARDSRPPLPVIGQSPCPPDQETDPSAFRQTTQQDVYRGPWRRVVSAPAPLSLSSIHRQGREEGMSRCSPRVCQAPSGSQQN